MLQSVHRWAREQHSFPFQAEDGDCDLLHCMISNERKPDSRARKFVFFCTPGWRSALAAGIAEQMELKTCNIDRGFEAWNAFGWEVAH
ncbi:MAG: hypothetical protein GWP64_02090 [Gammaproteobacteria bacterium]|jgi:rhodanese-related sulfurtransferase|nr:hypothetical protein [Gammaproteobacteria bacterium]